MPCQKKPLTAAHCSYHLHEEYLVESFMCLTSEGNHRHLITAKPSTIIVAGEEELILDSRQDDCRGVEAP